MRYFYLFIYSPFRLRIKYALLSVVLNLIPDNRRRRIDKLSGNPTAAA